MKKYLLFLALLICSITACSCALFRQPLDKMSRFSSYLKETELYIRKDQWNQAAASLSKASKAWKQVKPYLQVDIDHDYVNDIETDFIRLRGNIETEAKSDSLALILVIQDNWRNIGSM
ncbi:MAG: DUF4363 family protein [Bacteroidota bacterium]